MFGPVGIIGTLVFFAIVAGIVILAMRMNARNFRSDVRRGDIRAYAKRYLKRFPDTGRKSLRESLQQEFLPERIPTRSRDNEFAGCFLFGLGGVMGAAAGHHMAASMGDAEIKRINGLIDDVIDDLFEDDDEPDRMERPKGGLP
jgi:hypothetical protein